jgi:hypothetical protein
LAGTSSTGNYAIFSNASSAITFSTSGVERGRISSTGVWSLGALVGAESLRVTPVASAVNYLSAFGAATAGFPSLQVQGSDTNIGMVIAAKGTSPIVTQSATLQFQNTSGQVQFLIASTASAVNYLQVTGGATGNSPSFSAQGSDTNISLNISGKGTGGIGYFGGAHTFYGSGAPQLQIAVTASAVDYLQVTGNAAGFPSLSAQGTSANVTIVYGSKGTGNHNFTTNGVSTNQFVVAHTASAVNYLQVTGSAGSSPSVSAQGTSANVNVTYATKGTGFHNFTTGGLSTSQFVVSHTASAVNYLQVTGGATGNGVSLSAQGSDTNIAIGVSTKGTGNFDVYTNNYSARQFQVSNTASAVNFLQVTGGATGGGAVISSQGSDANIPIDHRVKGTSYHIFTTNNGSSAQFLIQNTTSAVNYAQVTGSATGNGVVFSAQGSDTNIDLKLTPKGTGVLSFGTYTAGILAQAGYIQIKDAAGNVRNLLVG